MSANGSSVTRILSFFGKDSLNAQVCHSVFVQTSLATRAGVFARCVIFASIFLTQFNKDFLHLKNMGIIFLGLNFVSQSLGEVAYLLCCSWDELGMLAAHTPASQGGKKLTLRGPFFRRLPHRNELERNVLILPLDGNDTSRLRFRGDSIQIPLALCRWCRRVAEDSPGVKELFKIRAWGCDWFRLDLMWLDTVETVGCCWNHNHGFRRSADATRVRKMSSS